MKIIAFTGAGISKSAGIPTFEEIPGIKDQLTVEYKQSHPKEFQQAIDLLVNNVKNKEPTKAHKILAENDIPIITMNVDNLHKKAGSKTVYEIHGNYLESNIVLYGQRMHHAEEAINLVLSAASEARQNNDTAILLVIGTSMQTAFAGVLALMAEQEGMKVFYINQNADEEVEKFFELIK